MDQPKRYLITSALPYANGLKHIGHLAGAYLPADIYVRYLRSKGEDVKFICGSDEHGVPITLRARKEGITPQQVVDKYHSIIKKSFSDFGISFDIYHRTSEKIHYETAADFFTDIERRKGGMQKGTTPRKEDDLPIFLSGIFNDKTTGAPLTIIFENNNTRSGDYEKLRNFPRPGHADFVAGKKFGGHEDYRGGGHFSGRLTVCLVAAGVVAKKILLLLDNTINCTAVSL